MDDFSEEDQQKIKEWMENDDGQLDLQDCSTVDNKEECEAENEEK